MSEVIRVAKNDLFPVPHGGQRARGGLRMRTGDPPGIARARYGTVTAPVNIPKPNIFEKTSPGTKVLILMFSKTLG